jgi:hypothetical protein
MDLTILGHDSRYTDGPLAATDTDAADEFNPLNVKDLRKYTQWKAASSGQKYITVDTEDAGAVADGLGIRGHNLGTAAASIVVESSPGFSFSDAFDNAALDPAKFGTSLAAAGSVVETTSLAISAPLAADAAIVYDKQVFGTRLLPWATRHKVSTPGDAVPAPFLALYQDAATPAVAAQAAFMAKVMADITQDSSGDIRFTYLDTADVRWYWDGADWQNSDDIAYAGVISTVYVTRLISDGTDLIFEIWDSTETTLHATASIPWTSIKAEADDLYACFGNPFTDQTAGIMTSTLYEREGEAGSVWTNRLAAFTPDSDGNIFREVTSAPARYWRLGVLTASVVPYIGILVLGSTITMPYSPDAPINLYDEGIKARTQDDDSGELLGTTIKSRNRRFQFSISTIDRAFVFGTLKDFWDNHSRDRNPFFIIPYPDDFPDAVWWMRNDPSYRWTTPLRFFEWVEAAMFRLVGPIEDHPTAGDV